MVSHAMKITSGGLEALDTVLRRQAPSDLHLELVHKVEAIRLASDRGSKRAACQITLTTNTHIACFGYRIDRAPLLVLMSWVKSAVVTVAWIVEKVLTNRLMVRGDCREGPTSAHNHWHQGLLASDALTLSGMAWIKKTSENVRSEKFDRISTDHYKYFRTASIKDESMKPARHTARNDTLLFQPLTIKVHPGPARSPSYPMSSLDTLCIGTSSQLLCTIVTQTFSTPGRLASVSMPLRSIIWQSECCTSLQLPKLALKHAESPQRKSTMHNSVKWRCLTFRVDQSRFCESVARAEAVRPQHVEDHPMPRTSSFAAIKIWTAQGIIMYHCRDPLRFALTRFCRKGCIQELVKARCVRLIANIEVDSKHKKEFVCTCMYIWMYDDVCMYVCICLSIPVWIYVSFDMPPQCHRTKLSGLIGQEFSQDSVQCFLRIKDVPFPGLQHYDCLDPKIVWMTCTFQVHSKRHPWFKDPHVWKG